MYMSDYARGAIKKDLGAYKRKEFKHKSGKLPMYKPDYMHNKGFEKNH